MRHSPRVLPGHRAEAREPAVVNVCFHGIGTPRRELEPGEEAYWIAVDDYHRILDTIGEDSRVRISFDDANASDVELGLPGLLERGLRARFFALAGRLDKRGSLAASELRVLVEAGMSIGSHGMNHVSWRGLDSTEQHRELHEARVLLEDACGAPVDTAALPLGSYDRVVLAGLRREGYRAVYTSDRRWARPGSWLQPRFSVRRGDSVRTLREQMLTPAPPILRARHVAAGLVKRYR